MNISWVRKALTIGLNLLFPGRCCYCRTSLTPEDRVEICSRCTEEKLKITSYGPCPRCSHPLSGANCPACRLNGIPETVNRSMLLNTGGAQDFLYDYKFNGRKTFSLSLAESCSDYLAGYENSIDCLVPVPPNPHSVFERGYCQVEEVVTRVSRRLNIPVIRCFRKKSADTSSAQHFKKLSERKKDMNSRYVYQEKYIKALEEKKVLLVDDIYTSGSTIETLSDMIRVNNPGVKIEAFTFARSLME